jgi:hypothetical protein
MENINLASAGAVLYYLHKQVVPAGCSQAKPHKRFGGISHVWRYKVTMENTKQVWEHSSAEHYPLLGPHLFAPFAQFGDGRCRSEGCTKWWKDFGYSVGCEVEVLMPSEYGASIFYQSRFSNSQWYSLPGRCPTLTNEDPRKFQDCAAEEPGGQCGGPNGTQTCTWKIEDAGKVALDDLIGIDFDTLCNEEKKEYDQDLDRGEGVTFWDHRHSQPRNAERTRLLLKLFKDKFSNSPYLLDPVCDEIQS